MTTIDSNKTSDPVVAGQKEGRAGEHSEYMQRLFAEADANIQKTLDAVLPHMAENLRRVSPGTRDALFEEFGLSSAIPHPEPEKAKADPRNRIKSFLARAFGIS